MTRFSRIFLFALLLATGTTAHAQTVPAAATLVSPSGTISDFMPTYTWNAVPNATYYQLWVGGILPSKQYSASEAGCASGTGTCSITASSALAAGNYTWYVQTWNNSGYGPWSSPMSFTFSRDPPAAATLVSPSGTITTTTPTYIWNAVSNASYYVLSDGTGLQTWYSAAQAGCGSGAGACSITGSALADGNHTWYVQTYNRYGYGAWSSGMSFITISSTGGVRPIAATLVSPSGTITTTTPIYTWNAVSSAIWYKLWDGTAATWYSAAEAGCGSGTGICSITGSALAAGNYTWYVRTWNSTGYGPWSSGMSFTITANGGMNDTGITTSQCYQAGSNTLVACSSAGALALNNAQDGMVGRDAAYTAGTLTKTGAGAKGFDFTKITNGGCVQDNVTGLMWEVKTNDGGLRDWNKTYTNYSATYSEYGTATDAAGFVIAVNTSNLCGFSDWRLPSADELQSIVDYGVASPGPTIDATWFPNTQGGAFWSASPIEGRSSTWGSAWGVSFSDGDDVGHLRNGSYYVRLVRAGPSPIQNRYTVSADGQEVTDNKTQLIWRRCPEGMTFSGISFIWETCTRTAISTFTHEAALRQAATQATSSGIAWRLPNIKELASIADRSRTYPAIHPTAFPATPSDWFWSSSPYVGYSGDAWHVDFGYGGFGHGYGRGGSYYVRLVRDGQ